MKLTIELSPQQARVVEELAKRLGIAAEELARAALADVLDQPKQDFEKAAQHVLSKNKDLYQRLR